MMEIILYLYKKSKTLISMGMPMSVLKERSWLLDRIISSSTMYLRPIDYCFLDEYKNIQVDRFYEM